MVSPNSTIALLLILSIASQASGFRCYEGTSDYSVITEKNSYCYSKFDLTTDASTFGGVRRHHSRLTVEDFDPISSELNCTLKDDLFEKLNLFCTCRATLCNTPVTSAEFAKYTFNIVKPTD